MRTRDWILLSGACAALACGGKARDDGEDPDTGVPTGLATSADDTGADEGGVDDGGEDDGGVKLDFAMGDDDGGSETGSTGDPCMDVQMTESNQGCEFWAVDLPNAWAGINGSPSPADQQFAVVIANTASDADATVEVFLGASPTPIDSAVVGIDATHTFQLPAASLPPARAVRHRRERPPP